MLPGGGSAGEQFVELYCLLPTEDGVLMPDRTPHSDGGLRTAGRALRAVYPAPRSGGQPSRMGMTRALTGNRQVLVLQAP